MMKGMEAEERAILARGVVLFNDGEYFACHEVWEELWKRSAGEQRAALQGLIQAAVAILHAEHGNHRGAVSVYRKAMRNLEEASDDCMGLRLGDFRSALKEFFAELTSINAASERRKIKIRNACDGSEPGS
jgi:predicted metal-dependent hydrolase